MFQVTDRNSSLLIITDSPLFYPKRIRDLFIVFRIIITLLRCSIVTCLTRWIGDYMEFVYISYNKVMSRSSNNGDRSCTPAKQRKTNYNNCYKICFFDKIITFEVTAIIVKCYWWFNRVDINLVNVNYQISLRSKQNKNWLRKIWGRLFNWMDNRTVTIIAFVYTTRNFSWNLPQTHYNWKGIVNSPTCPLPFVIPSSDIVGMHAQHSNCRSIVILNDTKSTLYLIMYATAHRNLIAGNAIRVRGLLPVGVV